MSPERIELLAGPARVMSFAWRGREVLGLAILSEWTAGERRYYEIATDAGVVVVFADTASAVRRWYVEAGSEWDDYGGSSERAALRAARQMARGAVWAEATTYSRRVGALKNLAIVLLLEP